MSAERILVVDDEPDIRDIVKDILSDEGYDVVTAENADVARTLHAEKQPDLVLLDIWMPGTDGITLLKHWQEEKVSTPIIMISGHGTVETAVDAIRHGAYDFLEKPLSTAKMLVTVQRAMQNRRLQLENQKLRGQLDSLDQLVGKSDAMEQLRSTIERIARTETWVLITGNPGTGKGVAARYLHSNSERREQPFVHVGLGGAQAVSLPVQLFGSEEADNVQPGYFDQARGGTLFLDEICDLDLATQTSLLNAFEKGFFIRVGGQESIDINVRVIAATNRDITNAVVEGRFREDLFYRLNAMSVRMPDLHEHHEDVPELVSFYTDRISESENLPWKQFSTAALNELRDHPWPGNVRELKNIVQRLLIVTQNDEIGINEVAEALGSRPTSSPNFPQAVLDDNLRDARDNFERAYFNFHLAQTGNNISEVAQTAGLERTHVYRKLKSLGIETRTRKADS